MVWTQCRKDNTISSHKDGTPKYYKESLYHLFQSLFIFLCNLFGKAKELHSVSLLKTLQVSQL